MSTTRIWRRAALLGTASVLIATSGFSAPWLRTAVDPTCAVIEKAEYDAFRHTISITGRSSELVTLRIYEKTTHDTLVVAEKPEPGTWTVEFELVGANATPGMVVVQGINGCATFRTVTEDTFGTGPQTEEGIAVASR
jgi:hypothetical protein